MALTLDEKREYIRLHHILTEHYCKKSFKRFVVEAWHVVEPGRPFVDGWHIDAICEHLEAVFYGKIRNLLINVPPRHAKSTIVSVMYPAWVWLMTANHKFIYASNSFNLSKRDSVKCRALVQSEWYRNQFNIQWGLADDQNEKMKFDNTMGGFRFAASVLGSIIGQGGDTLVVDDPIDTISVKSELQRQKVIDWFDEGLSIRVNDPKTVSKIIIMQRLHEDDLSGHVLSKGGWDHLCLPAYYEPEATKMTSIGWKDPRKKADDPLWPKRFGKPELEDMKRNMGSMVWAGQGQQRPAPADGTIVQRGWWKTYNIDPTELDLDFIALSADLTFDEGKKNDFVAIGVWGRKGVKKYLLDQVRARMGFNQQILTMKALSAKWPRASAKWVEKAANGAALLAILQDKIPGLIKIIPKGSKINRAEAIAPDIEAGNVYLPDPLMPGFEWVNDYIEEWAVFPNGRNDDQVDQTSQAIMKLRETASTDWVPISVTGQSKWVGR